MYNIFRGIETQLHRISLPLKISICELSQLDKQQQLVNNSYNLLEFINFIKLENGNISSKCMGNAQAEIPNRLQQTLQLRGRIRRLKYKNIINKLNITRLKEDAYRNRRELIRRAYSLHGLDFDKLLAYKHSK